MENPQLLLQNRLRQALVETRARNPRLSVRMFAKRLGLPAGTVSLVLLGKRTLSRATALRFAKALDLDPVERATIENGAYTRDTPKSARDSIKLQPEQLRLSADQFHILKDWHYYAILNLICITGESHKPADLARRLGLSEKSVVDAIDRMLRLDLIRVDEDQRFHRTHRQLKSTDDIESQSLRHSHQQGLELARDALAQVAIGSRDFSSLTLPIDTVKLPAIKAEIRGFYAGLVTKYARDPEANEVYQVQLQAFPLTKVGKS